MRTQLHHLLEEGAVRFGDRPALSHQEVTLDYASAWDLASRTGAVLSGLGVARGDRVAVYLDKRTRDRRRRSSAPPSPAACSCRSTRCSRARRSPTSSATAACGCSSRRPSAGSRLREDAKGCRALRARAARRRRPGRRPRRGRGAGARPVGASWATRSTRRPRAGRSTSTWPRSSTPPAAPASRRASCSRTATCSSGAESVSHLPRERRRRRHPGRAAAELRRRASASSRRRSPSARTSCWSTTCWPATSYACARKHGVTGLTCVPPLWIQLADQPLAGGGDRAACATSPTPAAGCRGRRSTGCARSSRRRSPYLMYGLTEAFRSTYLDPAEVDRRPDSIGKAIPNAEILVVRAGRHAVRARARRASWSTAARWSRWATGTTRSARPSGSGPLPGARPTGARPSWPSGRATPSSPTRRASSTSSAATTR